MNGRLDMSLSNDVQEVARVIDRLEEFGAANAIPEEQALRFGLVLDELITNIISHGLPGRRDGRITLAVERRGDVLHGELTDNGPAFDPLNAGITPPQGGVEDRPLGGLGLTLVKSVVDRLDYKREHGLNHVIMELKLKAS